MGCPAGLLVKHWAAPPSPPRLCPQARAQYWARACQQAGCRRRLGLCASACRQSSRPATPLPHRCTTALHAGSGTARHALTPLAPSQSALWLIPFEELTVVDSLGAGSFGKVYSGEGPACLSAT